MDELKKEKIALEVIKTLKSRFDNFPEDASDNRNAPFHEAFLKAFKIRIEEHVTDVPIFVSLASWMHGLNTSVGQSFFESVAHILCDGEKRVFKDLLINPFQQSAISEIMISLKNKKLKPSLIKENELLFNNMGQNSLSIQDFSADVYFEDDEKIVAIELKTVKPNSGIFNKEKEKILNAKAGLKNKYPEKEIFFYLGFPFDPLNEEECGFDKNRFFNYGIEFKKFFDPSEVLLADELWDFLSEENNTMQTILDVINSISKPDFMEKFNFINNYASFHIDPEHYKNILQEWFLKRDLEIVQNFSSLISKSEKQKNIKRLLKQNLFDKEGKYKENRINTLLWELHK
ncbi:MAG: hypothetical protein A2V93_07685 [Ignavibacteria bacterium RBG_16_34_14]|nr:MAG: hypothetical protein A2V93_07685 [Ignavibacteria bacterium RBG_16_34_14]